MRLEVPLQEAGDTHRITTGPPGGSGHFLTSPQTPGVHSALGTGQTSRKRVC